MSETAGQKVVRLALAKAAAFERKHGCDWLTWSFAPGRCAFGPKDAPADNGTVPWVADLPLLESDTQA